MAVVLSPPLPTNARSEVAVAERPHWGVPYSLVAIGITWAATLGLVLTAGPQRPELLFVLLGLLWIGVYLLLFPPLVASSRSQSNTRFEFNIVGLALLLRLAGVCASYWGFTLATGIPFEFHASDSLWYHQGAERFADNLANGSFGTLYSGIRAAPSDLGYVSLVGAIYALTGANVIIVRVLQAVLAAWSVVLLYRTARLAVGESSARTVAILGALNPYLIYYSGLHLKETVLIYLMMEVFYRTVKLSSKKGNIAASVAILFGCIGSMFFFRTFLAVLLVLGVGAHFIRRHQQWSRGRQLAIAATVMLSIVAFTMVVKPELGEEVVYRLVAGGDQWEREMAQKEQGLGQSISSTLASRPLFVALATVGPLPGVVAIPDQENGLVQFGFAWIRHLFLFFAILGLWQALRNGGRDVTVIAVTVVGYAVILGAAGLPSSHRFQVPTLPAWTIFTGVGLHASLPKRIMFTYWVIVLLGIATTVFIWNYLKIAVRGY